MADKNPLTIAFGEVLKRQRDISGRTSDEIAEAIGIGSSYYRLMESGTNNLHISKAIKLVTAFEETLTFDGVSKILMAISLMEVSANKLVQDAEVRKADIAAARSEGYIQAKNELSNFDHRLKLLFERFDEHNVFEKVATSQNDIIESLAKNTDIKLRLQDFLANYEDFGKPQETLDSEFANEFLDDVPTFYIDYLNSDKNKYLRMLVRIHFRDLWQWENENQNNFTGMFCLFTNPDDVTSYQNLKRYKYKHLWGNQYNEALFICITDKSSNEVKSEFKRNLKTSLSETNEYDESNFDLKCDKLQFKTISKEVLLTNKEIAKFYIDILTGKDVNSEKKDATTIYEALWIHTLSFGYSVGFLANVKNENEIPVEGISITVRESKIKIKKFNELWELLM